MVNDNAETRHTKEDTTMTFRTRLGSLPTARLIRGSYMIESAK
jgi:hypothetical protein